MAQTINQFPTTPLFNSVPNAISSDALLNQSKKSDCIAKGGTWDEATQTCNLPKKEEQPGNSVQQNKPLQAPTQPEYWKDEKGNVTGLTLPNGDSYLDLKPNDVNAILGKYNQVPSQVTQQNIQPVGTEQNMIQQQQRIAQLTQMAQQGLLTPEELQAIQGANLDYGQAAGAGILGAVPGLIGVGVGAALSATGAGSVLGVPLATAGALSAGAAIAGAVSGAKSNLKQQQTEEFAADQTALLKGERGLRALITDTNRNPQNAPENIELFYKTLNMIDAAHAKTWKDSQEDLNKFMGNDGTEQLQKFEVFDSTMRDYYIRAFNAALTKPNPNQILLTTEDLNDNG